MSNKTIHFIDYDGTIMNSILPEEGKKIYKEKTGNDYPHIGWWGRPESMDMEIFEIVPKPEVYDIYNKIKDSDDHQTVLMTNRQKKLSKHVEKTLVHHNIYFNHYSYKDSNESKAERILRIMKTHYPETINIVFYDDDVTHIIDAEQKLKELGYNIVCHKINSDLDYKQQDEETKKSY